MRRDASGRAKIRVGSSTAAILAGDDDCRAWEDEELIRGYRKNKNGGWTGHPPKIIPKSVHDELMRRTFEPTSEILRRSTVVAATALEQIIQSPHTSDSDRLKAIGMVFDRILGKAPERVQLAVQAVEAPWQKALNLAIVGSLEQAEARNALDDDIVDAELVIDPNEEIIDPWDDLPDEAAPVGQHLQTISSRIDQPGQRPTGWSDAGQRPIQWSSYEPPPRRRGV